MSNPPKEGTSEWDQWCSQDGALQKALCIIWSQTHVPDSPTPTVPSPTPKPNPNPAAASAPSITAAPPLPPPDKPPSNANNGVTIRPSSANSANSSPSKTQNTTYTEGISSTITSATVASNTVGTNLSTNQTSSITSAPTTTTTIDSSNFDNQTASNPAATAMKFWIPLIGVIVLVLIVFTIATCLGYQFVRRRKLKKQLKRATLGSLEKGEELLNHCSSTGEVVSSPTDVSSTRSSSDNVVSDESPLNVDNDNNIFSGKITVDALTSTMYYNGQVVPPIGTRIIPPEDQIKLDATETQPEEVRYNSRSLVFPET